MRRIDPEHVAQLAFEGFHLAAIARQLGTSTGAIHNCVKRNGITVRKGRAGAPPAPPEVKRQAVEMALAGVSIPKILMALPLSSRTLARALAPYRAELEAIRAAKKAARDKKRGKPPRKRWRPRTAPKLSATDPRCAHLDCQIPLPEHGVCRPGVGNPCCVARGDRVTASPHAPPWGWLADEDYIATPDPAVEPVLARLVRLVESGMSADAVARALRWSRPSVVEHRMELSGRMYQRWLAVRAAGRRVAA